MCLWGTVIDLLCVDIMRYNYVFGGTVINCIVF